jgi:hypothetical protein
MKSGGGIKGLDDKSNGMEILMTEVFVKIKPTDPLILAKRLCVFICNWIKKRREPRANNVTL